MVAYICQQGCSITIKGLPLQSWTDKHHCYSKGEIVLNDDKILALMQIHWGLATFSRIWHKREIKL